MSWYIQTEVSKYTNMVFFHLDSWLVQQFFMTQLVYKRNWKIIHQSWIAPKVHCMLLMKDVLQLTAAIVMASSAKKKNMTPKVLKQY